jgi:hypothetical protein
MLIAIGLSTGLFFEFQAADAGAAHAERRVG